MEAVKLLITSKNRQIEVAEAKEEALNEIIINVKNHGTKYLKLLDMKQRKFNRYIQKLYAKKQDSKAEMVIEMFFKLKRLLEIAGLTAVWGVL